MLIQLDNWGQAIPDVECEPFAKIVLHNKDNVHVSNMLAVDCIRAELFEMPKETRPDIKWVFYGKEVHFNDNLRSNDAYANPLTRITESVLLRLLPKKV
jgi:hypothetical protein